MTPSWEIAVATLGGTSYTYLGTDEKIDFSGPAGRKRIYGPIVTYNHRIAETPPLGEIGAGNTIVRLYPFEFESKKLGLWILRNSMGIGGDSADTLILYSEALQRWARTTNDNW